MVFHAKLFYNKNLFYSGKPQCGKPVEIPNLLWRDEFFLVILNSGKWAQCDLISLTPQSQSRLSGQENFQKIVPCEAMVYIKLCHTMTHPTVDILKLDTYLIDYYSANLKSDDPPTYMSVPPPTV